MGLALDQGERETGTLLGPDEPADDQPIGTGVASLLREDGRTVVHGTGE